MRDEGGFADRAPKDPKAAASFDYKQNLNPSSLEIIPAAKLEPSLGPREEGPTSEKQRMDWTPCST